MLSIIAAVSKNNVIGKDNKLIWHIPEDLKRFKKITTGHTIIMGRKTFESLNGVLPDRKHIVITKDKNYKVYDENVEVINDLSLLKKHIESDEECFVIGGASIYKLLMPYAEKMYITLIDQEFNGDSYFPKISSKEWLLKTKELIRKNNKNPYNYEFITYVRK